MSGNFTFIDKAIVFKIIVRNIAYSKPGELTNHQILYWITFLGMYRFIGRAFNANSIHFRFQIKWETKALKYDQGLRPNIICSNLIFVKIAVFVFIFTFVLKCDYHKTNENVYHKKCDDYNVGHKEHGHSSSIVINGSFILSSRIYSFV